MKRRRLGAAAVLLAVGAAALALAAASSARQAAPFKAAWIYVGPHNDGGWSQAHDVGRLAVQRALGSKVQTTYKELVPEGPQTCQVIESLIRDGNKIIFSTSFGFQACVVSEAKKHPDVLFEQATGTAQSKNVAEYFGAGEDSIYLSGMAAGAATKKGVIGYIVPFPIPEVIRHANAFALGAQAMHPGREGAARLDAQLGSPDERAQGGREPRRRGRGRARPERRHAVGGPVRGVEEDPVGRLRLEREEVRADVVADGRGLRLGRLLRPAREGRDERHLEDGLLLRDRSRTASPTSRPSGRGSPRRRRPRSGRSGRR